MRKVLIVGLVAFALVATTGVITVGAQTTFDSTWSGAGFFNVSMVAGDDATSYFETFGSTSAIGAFHGVDYDNNPYGYNVDTVLAQVEANIAGGGWLMFDNIRTDSYVPMYGAPGEQSWTRITTDDTAQLQFRTRSAYAELQSSNYGFQANNHFLATGTFDVYHKLSDDTGEGAYVWNYGTGSTDIDFMSESTWGKTGSFNFGKGSGCYTNADVSATGSGVFEVGAIAENQIDIDLPDITIYGDGTLGSAQYLIQATYGAGFNFGNFALSGN